MFRSYEGAIIAFNYRMNTLCSENVFSRILKDILNIFRMFLQLHSRHPSSCLLLQETHLYSCINGSLDFCLDLGPVYGGPWCEF